MNDLWESDLTSPWWFFTAEKEWQMIGDSSFPLSLSDCSASFIFLQILFCNHTWIMPCTWICNSYFPQVEALTRGQEQWLLSQIMKTEGFSKLQEQGLCLTDLPLQAPWVWATAGQSSTATQVTPSVKHLLPHTLSSFSI
jgi:hypothetical protein